MPIHFQLAFIFRPHSKDNPQNDISKQHREGGWAIKRSRGSLSASDWLVREASEYYPCPWPCATHNEACECTFFLPQRSASLLDVSVASLMAKQLTSCWLLVWLQRHDGCSFDVALIAEAWRQFCNWWLVSASSSVARAVCSPSASCHVTDGSVGKRGSTHVRRIMSDLLSLLSIRLLDSQPDLKYSNGILHLQNKVPVSTVQIITQSSYVQIFNQNKAILNLSHQV